MDGQTPNTYTISAKVREPTNQQVELLQKQVADLQRQLIEMGEERVRDRVAGLEEKLHTLPHPSPSGMAARPSGMRGCDDTRNPITDSLLERYETDAERAARQ